MNRPVKAYLAAFVAAMTMQAGAAFAQPGGPPGGGGGKTKAEDLFAPRYVFVTPPDYNGYLGGLAGADAICQEWADSEDSLVPAGDYVAILSSTVKSALSRVGPSLGPIVKPNGEQVAENTAHLFSLTYDFIDGELFLFNVLVSPIDTLANGEPVDGQTNLGPVWTGSDASGQPASNDPAELCSNWTTDAGSKSADGVGSPFNDSVGWIAVDLISASVASPNNRTCDQLRSLYCIQK